MPDERVIVNIAEGIADVRFNRADKRNALDREQFAAISEAGEALKRADGVRVIVLSGEGASFCAGIDLSMFASLDQAEAGARGNPGALTQSGLTHLAQQVCWVWREQRVPVIAAVHGHALGGGFQIALGADIRVVHPDTKLSVRELHWGLIPDMTGTFTLSRLVRDDLARELTYTARIVDGREAFELGIATKLSDEPRTTAMQMAAEIAASSPDAIQAAKSLFERRFAGGAADQFAAEREAIGRLIGSANQREAVAANVEGRPPIFAD
jgi:enoyl-CoA hydratase/carnithine racemase